MDREELIARLKENPNYKAEVEESIRRLETVLHYPFGWDLFMARASQKSQDALKKTLAEIEKLEETGLAIG